MSVTLLDGLLILIVVGSAILAMMRGFVREVLSIGSWVAAAAGTYYFYPIVVEQVKIYTGITDDMLARAIAIGGLFLIILIVVSYLTMRISDIIIDSRIGPLDRTLGFMFGAARGLLIFVIGMLFFNFFVQDNQPNWIANAKSRPMLNKLGEDLLAVLPEDPEKEVLDRMRKVTDNLANEQRQNILTGGSSSEDPNAYKQGQRQELERLIQNNAQ
jgi:membrane protein required for colicin V production